MGILFIISAPSGAGKTSLLKHVVAKDNDASLSISYTTRAPRAGEICGLDYNFISYDAFLEMEKNGEFLEFAEVFGNMYGTAKSHVDSQLAAGDVLLELDWQGALNIKKIYPNAVWVFVLPPSIEVLANRLSSRNTNTEADINSRLAQAKLDMKYAYNADYALVNRDFEQACAELLAVLHAERLRISRQKLVVDAIIEN